MIVNEKGLEQLRIRWYGEHKIDRVSKNGQTGLIILKSINLEKKDQLEEFTTYFENRNNVRHPNVCELDKMYSRENKGLCSTSYHIDYSIEFHPHNLELEFKNRQNQGFGFSSVDLYCILHDVLDGLWYMDSYDIQHCNIRPSNLLLPQIKEAFPPLKVKILDNLQDRNGAFFTSQLAMNVSKNPIYLSPYQLSVFNELSAINTKSQANSEYSGCTRPASKPSPKPSPGTSFLGKSFGDQDSITSGRLRRKLAFSGDMHALGIVILELGLMESIAEKMNPSIGSPTKTGQPQVLVVKEAYERFVKRFSSEFRLVEMVKSLIALGSENSRDTEQEWLRGKQCEDFIKWWESNAENYRATASKPVLLPNIVKQEGTEVKGIGIDLLMAAPSSQVSQNPTPASTARGPTLNPYLRNNSPRPVIFEQSSPQKITAIRDSSLIQTHSRSPSPAPNRPTNASGKTDSPTWEWNSASRQRSSTPQKVSVQSTNINMILPPPTGNHKDDDQSFIRDSYFGQPTPINQIFSNIPIAPTPKPVNPTFSPPKVTPQQIQQTPPSITPPLERVLFPTQPSPAHTPGNQTPTRSRSRSPLKQVYNGTNAVPTPSQPPSHPTTLLTYPNTTQPQPTLNRPNPLQQPLSLPPR